LNEAAARYFSSAKDSKLTSVFLIDFQPTVSWTDQLHVGCGPQVLEAHCGGYAMRERKERISGPESKGLKEELSECPAHYRWTCGGNKTKGS
jgi:hypothetical protein